MRTIAVVALFGSMLVAAVACGSAENVSVQPCDPDAPFPDDVCRAQADAGADSSDGSGGSSPLRAECAGRCAPRAFGTKSGGWQEPPLSVWIGPKNLMPSCCPGSPGCDADADAGTDGGPSPSANASDVPTLKYRAFSQIIAPPAECAPCECGASEGTCTGLPEKIEVRAGMLCDPNAPSLPFGGPPGWDGSCSNEGGLAAGAMCSGVPCAQSVWSPPLPGPTTESCTPKSATPKATIEKADWVLGALACMGEERQEECGDEGPFCLNDPGPGWLQCVYRDGVWDVCPDNYNQGRHVMYPEEADDDRGCEACSCDAPSGSGCLGTIPIYKDGACGSLVTNLLVSSLKDFCIPINPPGLALGSKEVTGLGYMPGSCVPSGGAPKGSAVGHVKDAVTFCCGPFFNIPK